MAPWSLCSSDKSSIGRRVGGSVLKLIEIYDVAADASPYDILPVEEYKPKIYWNNSFWLKLENSLANSNRIVHEELIQLPKLLLPLMAGLVFHRKNHNPSQSKEQITLK